MRRHCEATRRIDPKSRVVLDMKTFEGRSREEIAELLNCSVRTVAPIGISPGIGFRRKWLLKSASRLPSEPFRAFRMRPRSAATAGSDSRSLSETKLPDLGRRCDRLAGEIGLWEIRGEACPNGRQLGE